MYGPLLFRTPIPIQALAAEAAVSDLSVIADPFPPIGSVYVSQAEPLHCAASSAPFPSSPKTQT